MLPGPLACASAIPPLTLPCTCVLEECIAPSLCEPVNIEPVSDPNLTLACDLLLRPLPWALLDAPFLSPVTSLFAALFSPVISAWAEKEPLPVYAP